MASSVPGGISRLLSDRLVMKKIFSNANKAHRLEPHGLDDFRLSAEDFSLPENVGSFEPSVKRKLTICNLFHNHQQSISDIMRLLDETYGGVILALIENRLILERRTTDKPFSGTERRHSRGLNATATTDTLRGFATRLRRTSDDE